MERCDCRHFGTMTLTPTEDLGWKVLPWCFWSEREVVGKCPDECPNKKRRF